MTANTNHSALNYDSDDLRALLSAMAEDELSAADEQCLITLLKQSEAARAEYLHWADIQTALYWDFRDWDFRDWDFRDWDFRDWDSRAFEPNLSSIATSSSTPHSAYVRRKSLVTRILDHEFGVGISVAILTMVVGLVWASVTYLPDFAKQEEQKDDKPAVHIDDVFVARLDQRIDVTWLNNTEPPAWQPKLVPGQRLVISSGLLKIDYLTGATLVIEGPADFYLGGKEAEGKDKGKNQSIYHSSLSTDHSNSGYLALGKLVARCDTAKSKGFTIETPSASVVDFGTEFGVEVKASGATGFAVLAGEVDVVQQARSKHPTRRVRLIANQGALVSADGSIHSHGDVDARYFVKQFRRKLPPQAAGDPSRINTLARGSILDTQSFSPSRVVDGGSQQLTFSDGTVLIKMTMTATISGSASNSTFEHVLTHIRAIKGLAIVSDVGNKSWINLGEEITFTFTLDSLMGADIKNLKFHFDSIAFRNHLKDSKAEFHDVGLPPGDWESKLVDFAVHSPFEYAEIGDREDAVFRVTAAGAEKGQGYQLLDAMFDGSYLSHGIQVTAMLLPEGESQDDKQQ